MMKKVLLLDVDEVICFSGFLSYINEFLGSSYVIDDFEDYYLDEVAIPKDRFIDFNKFIANKNLYENAEILPRAVEVIKKLNEVYDIYICSSCINPFDVKKSGRLFKDKYNFLYEFLPFISPEKYIFTNAKSLINADIQIDDRLDNLNSNVSQKILFPSYHNHGVSNKELLEKGVLRAGDDWRLGWDEVERILLN